MAIATLTIDLVAKLASLERDMGKAAQIAEKNARRMDQAFSAVGKLTPHSLRHAYAARLFETGHDLTTVQKALGHKDPETTLIYTQVFKKGIPALISPLDE